MPRLSTTLAATTAGLAVLLLPVVVSPTCLGEGCIDEQEAAKSAGLLGSPKSCASKVYPSTGGGLSPVNLSSSVGDIHWAGVEHEKDKYVFLILGATVESSGGRVWRSSDYGKASSFVDVTSTMPGALDTEGADPYRNSGVVALHQHRSRPGKILFQGANNHYWRTEDYGATFTALDAPGSTQGFFHALKLHPNQHDWVLAKVRRNECRGGWAIFSRWCAFDLFVTENFGDSWTNLTANSQGYIASFQDFDWGALMHRGKRKDFVDKTILATAYESVEHMKGPYPDWDKDQHFVISHDFFTTQHQKVVSCGNQFEIVGSKVYLALPSMCPAFPDGGKRDVCKEPSYGSVIMYVSDDEAQTFTQACVPVRDLDLSYAMLNSHNGEGSFLMVDHDEEEWIPSAAPISNVYSAAAGSPIFSLAIPRAYRRNGMVDFSRVNGLPGVYLANQLSIEALEDHTYQFEKWVSTKVSFNGGARWQDLEKPERFRHASCDRCSRLPDQSKCKLHLHGPASYHSGPGSRPSFYSHYSAPGVIMAVGNTGENLDLAADDSCTWMSGDAGLTWQDIAEQPHIYEFGDLGGIVVMGKYEGQEPADRLLFSLDQGACWSSIVFQEAINIQNIRVEPRASSHVFMVLGKACRKSEEHPSCSGSNDGKPPAGKLYVVDIEAVMGDDFKVCGKEEYEDWSPPSPEQCLLGRNYTVHRRRPDAACFNAKGWEPPENSSHACPCQAEDLGCEFGYEWLGNECVQMTDIEAKQCPALEKGNYIMSETHKRLIQGDSCKGIEKVIRDTDGRGNVASSSKKSTSHWKVWLSVILVLSVAALGGCFCWSRGLCASFDFGSAGEWCIEVAMGIAASVTHLFNKLRAKLTGRHVTESGIEYFEPLSGGEDLSLHLDEEDARSPPILH